VRTLRACLFATLVLPTAGGARAAAAVGAPTYDEVYAAPDDIPLNLAFAQSEAAAGHLLSAAAAYERILILKPEMASVRLAYVKVLVRLDDREGALEQLRVLEGQALSPADAAEAARYRRLLAAQSRHRLSAYLSAGATYQSNVYGQFYSQLNIPGQVRKEPGSDSVVSATVEDVVRITDGGRVAVDLELAGYHQAAITGPDTRYDVGEARVGLLREGSGSVWRVSGLGRFYRLFGQPYIAEAGAEAYLAVGLGPHASVSTSGEAVWQDFHEPLTAQALAGLGVDGGHAGPRYNVSVSLATRPRPQDVAVVTVGYEAKSASYRPFSYDAPYVRASYSVPAGRDGWFTLWAEHRRVTGRDVDAIFLDGHRQADRLTSVRIDWEGPIGRLLDPAGRRRWIDGLGLQMGVGYDRRQSAAPLASYKSIGGRLMLVWRYQSRK
jgi:hypothetical protein